MEYQQYLDKAQEKIRSVYFRIADHLVRVDIPVSLSMEKCLPAFSAFIAGPDILEKPLLSVRLSIAEVPPDDPQAKLLSDVSVIWDETFRFEETTDHYITTIRAGTSSGVWKMVSSKNFVQSVIYAPVSELYLTAKFSWLIMIAYGQAALQRHTALIHASVVKKKDLGYIFLGKSGTGKSTHSRLWIENIKDTALLNDDNPAIRLYDNGEVVVFGTPWSGKTACYKQEKVGLGAIIRLEQAPFNKLQWRQGKEALITLLPSISAIRWNSALYANMLQIIETVIQHTPIGLLQCLPNKEAACLCYAEASRIRSINVSKPRLRRRY